MVRPDAAAGASAARDPFETGPGSHSRRDRLGRAEGARGERIFARAGLPRSIRAPGALFQHRTEALIINQVNNPGGSLHQIYALPGMLIDRRLPVHSHQITILDEDAALAADILTAADPLPPERVAYLRLLASERAAGRGTSDRLSIALRLDGWTRFCPPRTTTRRRSWS
jgi:hypothetical protein